MTSKEINIGSQRFRIIRMTPLVGSRIINVLFSAMSSLHNGSPAEEVKNDVAEFEAMPAEEKAKASISAMWVAAASVVSSDKYEEIQKNCLRCCQLYPSSDTDTPIPMMMASGRWAVPEPEITVVSQLITEALQFNLAPFFTESALKSAASAAPSNQ
jgi:hypothetical protein